MFSDKTIPFGIRVEEWVVRLLLEHGETVYATGRFSFEDAFLKIDFLVQRKRGWLAFQFTIDRKAIVGEKGIAAIRNGVVPAWLPPQQLEQAMLNGDAGLKDSLYRQFWSRVEATIQSFPGHIRYFRRPEAAFAPSRRW